MNKLQILVTLPLEHKDKIRFENTAKNEVFEYISPGKVTHEQVQKANIILGNVPPEFVINSPNLKWLQLNSAGADEYLKEGIMPEQAILTNSVGAYGLAVSEHLLAMLLEIKKKLYLYRDNQNKHLWKSEGSVTSIYNSTALIVGMGDIGGEFAKRIKALGAYVIGIKRDISNKPDYADELYTMDSIKQLLPRADIISVSLPSTPQTYKFFSEDILSLTKKGSVFLNAGRGNTADTDALCKLLKEGHFEGIGLDVTDPEPLPSGHPLWSIPNAIITPHISGHYHLHATLENIINISYKNLCLYINNKELINIVLAPKAR
ncbi:MAG: D-2-hydroxyacid dehydrogenase [Clostridia bacterium]|nr:D-2-hydroxyacid dehydrogenase [Clostridia bacterium]